MSQVIENHDKSPKCAIAYVCNHRSGKEELLVLVGEQIRAIHKYCEDTDIELLACFIDWQVGTEERAIESAARDYVIANRVDGLIICGMSGESSGLTAVKTEPDEFAKLNERFITPIQRAGKFGSSR